MASVFIVQTEIVGMIRHRYPVTVANLTDDQISNAWTRWVADGSDGVPVMEFISNFYRQNIILYANKNSNTWPVWAGRIDLETPPQVVMYKDRFYSLGKLGGLPMQDDVNRYVYHAVSGVSVS